MKNITLMLLLAISLAACGHQDAAVSEPKTSVFSLWKSAELGDLDLTSGRQGVFEMTVYRVYQSNPYRCFVTVNLQGNTAQVLYFHQDGTFQGAECRPLFTNMMTGDLFTFSLEVVDQRLQVSTQKADGSKTLAWVFDQDINK